MDAGLTAENQHTSSPIRPSGHRCHLRATSVTVGNVLDERELTQELIAMLMQFQNALRMTAASKLFAEYQHQLVTHRPPTHHQGESQAAMEYRYAIDLCSQAERLILLAGV